MKRFLFLIPCLPTIALATAGSLFICIGIAVADDISLSPQIEDNAVINATMPAPAPVSRAAMTSAAAAKNAGSANNPQIISRNISPVPVSAPPVAITEPARSTAPAANVSRVAITNPTAARAAAGDESARAAIAAQARGPISRSATMANAQSEEREIQRSAFHSNEKGIANESSAVRRAGVNLRPTTAEVGGRATLGTTDIMTGSNFSSDRAATARGTTARAAIANVTAATVAETSEKLSAIADLTNSCQEQYIDCMDQFCNVIDANQRRCSCSSRLSSYSKVEGAVKEANNKLNEVAQRIRYVGLSADEIRALMNATEAELALQGQRDTTENRRMLSQIEKLIKTPETFVADSGGGGLDLDFMLDFENMDATEMFSLDMFGGGGSFSNMRGTALYNAAKKKCANVLNTCKANGANTGQISARYDMEIDKDCIAYEKGLEKMNQTLKTNVRSATQMLQKARLAVLENHNQYDGKACIGALESCMTDDMVCGESYQKCMDPTKRYIDENGEVVLGQNITRIRDFIRCFDSSKVAELMAGQLTNTCDITENAENNGRNIILYLEKKIGTGDAATSGLCRAVLDKCRRYTYDANGKYNRNNEIVRTYIQRAMANIRAGQERIIADYASTCMYDLMQCYTSQVSQIRGWSTNASIANIYNVMKGACRNVSLTCAYAVFASDNDAGGSCPTNSAKSTAEIQTQCIESISNVFYQTLLCPDNADYTSEVGTANKPYTGTNENYLGLLYVNERCLCNDGFVPYLGTCTTCPIFSHFDPSALTIKNGKVTTVSNVNTIEPGDEGVPMVGCRCDGYVGGDTGYIAQNGVCVKQSKITDSNP